MTGADFVFSTLIANHPDPATASRAVALAEATALRRAAEEMDAHCEQYGVFGVGDRMRRIADETETSWNRQTAAPDFFQPGHSYTHRNDSTFRCVAVTTHPDSGERVALGWYTDTAGWTFVDVRNINHWNHEYDGVEPPKGGEVR